MKRSAKERFLAKCRREGGCLIWVGARQDMHQWRGNERNPRYAGAKENWRGQFRLAGKREYAHRAAWLLWVGEIPAGLVMRHSARCTSTLCVLVAHLLPGTAAENAADREAARSSRVPF